MWGVNKSHRDEMKDFKKDKKNILVRALPHSCLTHTLVWWWEQFPSLTYPRRRCFAAHLLLQRSFQIHPDWAASAASPSLFPNCLQLQLDFVQNKTFPSETCRGKKREKIMPFVQLDWKTIVYFQIKRNDCRVLFFFLLPRHTESKVPSPRTASQMPPLPSWQDINKYTESMQLPLRPVYWNVFLLHFWRTAGSAIYSNFPCAREPRCEWFHAMRSTVPLNFALPLIPPSIKKPLYIIFNFPSFQH